MDSRKFVFHETVVVAIGQAVCVSLMVGVFALLGKLNAAVVLGGIVGAVLAVANFFFMAIGVHLAADKAEAQDVKGGKAMLKSSYMLRLLVLFILLFAFAKSGLCNVIALVLPLAFVRPIITVAEFFRKSGETKQ